jgi:hypothetical protein
LCNFFFKKSKSKKNLRQNNLLVSNKEIEQGKKKTGKKIEKQDDHKNAKTKENFK